MIFLVLLGCIALLGYAALNNPKQFAPLYQVGRQLIFPLVKLYATLKNTVLQNDHLYSSLQTLEKLKGVHLSLSSTPSRIKTLHQTLDNLWMQVERVHLNLPRKFRNIEAFDEQDLLALQKRVPNLQVYWLEDDLGPVMKLLPTLERLTARAETKDSIVITIDDDILLPTASLAIFAETARKHNSVAMQFCGTYGASVDGVKYKSVFGNRGVAYPVHLFDNDALETMRKIHLLKECKMHDDMGIGMTLHKHNIPICNVDLKTEGGTDLPHAYTSESISYTQIVNFKDRDETCVRAAMQL